MPARSGSRAARRSADVCAFEQLDITADAALATWLLEIRGRLEDASSVEEERAMRAAFHHLLNESDE
jgi:hypothetical protein